MMNAHCIDPVAEGIRLIDRHQHDGHPFGLPPGCSEDACVLEIDDEGSARLRRAGAAISVPDLASLDSSQWSRVAPVVLEDFNRRLEAKGMPAGRFPRTGGRVMLHPCFGRELALAMLIGGDANSMAIDALRIWADLGGIWRLRLWRLVNAGNSVVTDVENRDSLRAAAMASSSGRRSRLLHGAAAFYHGADVGSSDAAR